MKDFNVELPQKLNFVSHFKMESVSEHKRHQGNAMAFCLDKVPEAVRMQTVLAGTSDDITGQIEKWIEAGCEHFGLQFLGESYWDSVKLFTEKVIPHFKK